MRIHAERAGAEDIRVHKCISMWETGDRNPSISMLKKLAEVLGCTADKLLDTEWRE